MRGVSRESLAGLRERLDEATAQQAAAAQRQIAEELFSVVHLLDDNPRLRRVLSDPATDPGRRERLVAGLLAEQVSAATAAVVTSLVRASWARPRDLVDAAGELAAQALFTTEEADDSLIDVEDELFRFGRILDREPQLRRALTDPTVPADRKATLLESLLGDRVRPATLELVRELVLHPRGRTVDAGLEEYARLAAARRERLVARVRTATALTEEQEERLGEALRASLGHRVHLNVEIAPELVGGLTVLVGDVLFDGSIAHRLALARRQMAG